MVVELPRGTVTFLFTDIEGSTRLLQRLGDGYGEVLERHRRILREAVSAHDGREVDTQGDSFFFAFSRANAAVSAAVAAQRALGAQEWPEGGEVRVRMGLHTGEPMVGDDRYVGIGVHRAARIGSVANGGQVLLSNATRELVDAVGVRDLGVYRLKDIERPERLFELDVDGLQADFPPLRAEKIAEPHPLRRRAVLLSALAGVTAAAVAIPIFAFGQGGDRTSPAAAAGDSVGVLGSGKKLVADIRVGATPTHLAVGEGAYWVSNADAHTVSRIDQTTKSVVQTIAVGSSPSGITTGNGAIWVANSLDGTVSRIDPSTNSEVQKIPVGNAPVGIAYADKAVWVANTGDGTITKIDADSGLPLKTLPVAATELAYGDGTLWATESTEGRVARIDPASGKPVATIAVGNAPIGIAFGSGSAWAANSLDGTVSRIDPVTNSQSVVIPTGRGPISVATGLGAVWVTNQLDGTVARIDPRTNDAKPISVGNRPQGVAVAGDNVLVSVRESGEGHRGGTLRFRMNRTPDTFDTAFAYDSASWTILRMTNDGLVAFEEAGGIQGMQLVPDLAESIPTPIDEGKTYTFRLRPNIRSSTGHPLKASDVRATFERNFRAGFPVPFYYDGILGAKRCEQRPKHCDLSQGIVTNDRSGTVAFHLVAPDPDFLNKLTLPFADVLPGGTKANAQLPLPATGPYVIARYRKNHLIELARNPYFHEWSKAAQPDGYPDRIVFSIGGTPDASVKQVVKGKADVFSTSQSENPPSKALLASVLTRYASRVHVNQQPATIALFLNTRLPPFDNVDARRALNYAADRAAAVDAAGGQNVGQVTCQILPPFYPGYRPYCPYTSGSKAGGTWTGPELAKALALVARSGTRGMKVTFWSWDGLGGLGPYAVKLLRSLGYRASLKSRGDAYFAVVGDSRTRAQIGTDEWISDYPAPSGFFNAVLTCASFVPRSGANANRAEFCDRHIDRQSNRALVAQTTNPDAAPAAWQRVDRETVNAAPWVPLVNPRVIDVLSKRVGNYQYSPAGLGVLIDQLWVR